MGWGVFKKIARAFKTAGKTVFNKVLKPVYNAGKKVVNSDVFKKAINFAPVVGGIVGGPVGAAIGTGATVLSKLTGRGWFGKFKQI